MFTQDSFAALFRVWRIGELFIEASDVNKVVTFNRDRVRIVCSIKLGLLHSHLRFKCHFKRFYLRAKKANGSAEPNWR
jgi:hypothetical protein